VCGVCVYEHMINVDHLVIRILCSEMESAGLPFVYNN